MIKGVCGNNEFCLETSCSVLNLFQVLGQAVCRHSIVFISFFVMQARKRCAQKNDNKANVLLPGGYLIINLSKVMCKQAVPYPEVLQPS